MFKKKFLGLSLIFLLVLFLGSLSTSYAYTFDDFIDFAGQIRSANISAVFNHHADLILTYQSNLRAAVGNDNYVSWVVKTYNSSTNYATILCYLSPTNITVTSSNNGTILPTNKQPFCSFTINQTNGTVNKSTSPSREDYFFAGSNFGLIETDSIVTNWYDLKFNNFYVPTPQNYFIPENDYVVTYKGQNDVNAILRNYSVNQWKIGETYNFSILNAFHMYLYDLTNNVQIGYVYAYSEIDHIYGGNRSIF